VERRERKEERERKRDSGYRREEKGRLPPGVIAIIDTERHTVFPIDTERHTVFPVTPLFPGSRMLVRPGILSHLCEGHGCADLLFLLGYTDE
jgi:hypothetical protein